MTSHDAMIETMSHLSAFFKSGCKITAFFAHTQTFVQKSANFSYFAIYFFISNGNEPISSPPTKKSALYTPV